MLKVCLPRRFQRDDQEIRFGTLKTKNKLIKEDITFTSSDLNAANIEAGAEVFGVQGTYAECPTCGTSLDLSDYMSVDGDNKKRLGYFECKNSNCKALYFGVKHSDPSLDPHCPFCNTSKNEFYWLDTAVSNKPLLQQNLSLLCICKNKLLCSLCCEPALANELKSQNIPNNKTKELITRELIYKLVSDDTIVTENENNDTSKRSSNWFDTPGMRSNHNHIIHGDPTNCPTCGATPRKDDYILPQYTNATYCIYLDDFNYSLSLYAKDSDGNNFFNKNNLGIGPDGWPLWRNGSLTEPYLTVPVWKCTHCHDGYTAVFPGLKGLEWNENYQGTEISKEPGASNTLTSAVVEALKEDKSQVLYQCGNCHALVRDTIRLELDSNKEYDHQVTCKNCGSWLCSACYSSSWHSLARTGWRSATAERCDPENTGEEHTRTWVKK